MLKCMLDTNIVIYVIKRRPIEILDIFNAHAGQMCISSITLAELLHGVEKSKCCSVMKQIRGYLRHESEQTSDWC